LSLVEKRYVVMGEKVNDYKICTYSKGDSRLELFSASEIHESFEFAKIKLLIKLDKIKSDLEFLIEDIEKLNEEDYYTGKGRC